MNCEQVLLGIWQYLDHDMSLEDVANVQKHLDLCRSCFSRLEFEQRLRDAMREKTNHCCPEKVKARIKSLLDLF